MKETTDRPGGRPAHTNEEKLFKRQVGQNLKTIRQKLHLDPKAFSDYLDIRKGTYEKYEMGIAFPKPQVWKRLAELGVSADFLVTGIGKPFLRPIDLSVRTSLSLQRKIS